MGFELTSLPLTTLLLSIHALVKGILKLEVWSCQFSTPLVGHRCLDYNLVP